MKRAALAALVCLAVFAPHTAVANTTETDCIEPYEREVAHLVNDYREENGLNRLAISDVLSSSAEHYVQAMAKYNFFGHTMPDGRDWADNQRSHGYTYNTWRGQNLAGGQQTPADVLAAWKSSPSHNSLMLDPEAVRIGVGYTRRDGTDYGWYWAADFGGYRDALGDNC